MIGACDPGLATPRHPSPHPPVCEGRLPRPARGRLGVGGDAGDARRRGRPGERSSDSNSQPSPITVAIDVSLSPSLQMPFLAENMPDVFNKIREAPPDLPPHISDELRALLLQILDKNPHTRCVLADAYIDDII